MKHWLLLSEKISLPAYNLESYSIPNKFNIVGNISTLSQGVGTGSATTYTITWTKDDVISINQNKSNSNTNVSSSYISAPRWYQNHLITFTPLSGSTIIKIEFTCDIILSM